MFLKNVCVQFCSHIRSTHRHNGTMIPPTFDCVFVLLQSTSDACEVSTVLLLGCLHVRCVNILKYRRYCALCIEVLTLCRRNNSQTVVVSQKVSKEDCKVLAVGSSLVSFTYL
eukprot:872232-Amphidinium_carterae.1